MKNEKKKIHKLTPLGWREWVFLPHHNNFKLKAKIDTGARTSSIHASNIQIFSKGEVKMVRFQLHQLKSLLNVETQLISFKKIKSSFGETEIRPLIHLEIQIGEDSTLTEITLAERSKLTYPMLIGRNTLKKRHIIHSHRSYIANTN